MKKIISRILAIIMVFSFSVAFADYDLGNLSYDELVELVNQAQRQIMFSDYWQEVEVPQGDYIIGEDIPAGKWVITASPTKIATVTQKKKTKYKNGFELETEGYYEYGVSMQLTGVETPHYSDTSWSSFTIELEDGDMLSVEYGSVIFTPYQGLGFKFKQN